MSFDAYLAAQQGNVEQNRRLAEFVRLVVPVGDLYDLAVTLIPPTAAAHFGQLLLVCHKAFMSSATLTLRALPGDGVAITRRALEAARLALAVKYDKGNLQRWLSFEQRMARGRARRRGEKQRLEIEIKYPANHALCEQLGLRMAMHSDSAVHFTPEILGQQSWHVDREVGTVRLNHFVEGVQVIKAAVAGIAVDHMLCLQAFDECYDGVFGRDARWGSQVEGIRAAGRELALPLTEQQQRDESR